MFLPGRGFQPRHSRPTKIAMSTNSKKSMGFTIVLVLLGVAALFGGARWLALLVPAAILVWYGAGSMRNSRN
jgi:hypothetical protein